MASKYTALLQCICYTINSLLIVTAQTAFCHCTFWIYHCTFCVSLHVKKCPEPKPTTPLSLVEPEQNMEPRSEGSFPSLLITLAHHVVAECWSYNMTIPPNPIWCNMLMQSLVYIKLLILKAARGTFVLDLCQMFMLCCGRNNAIGLQCDEIEHNNNCAQYTAWSRFNKE